MIALLRRLEPSPPAPVPPVPPAPVRYYSDAAELEGLVDNLDFYQPVYHPWLDPAAPFQRYGALGAAHALGSPDRYYVLLTLLEQALSLEGDVWECGVYKGGTARMIAAFLEDRGSPKRLLLFDTFAGMPATDPSRDWHKQGDFDDTSLDAVREFVGFPERCDYYPGQFPSTFAGLERRAIAFAHIDADIYRSITDCLEFIWPRLAVGGCVVFDDYGFPTCPGARRAVDDFFAGSIFRPLVLPTGQAIAFKSIPAPLRD
ncbi:MAG: class I SAM-dependent methyltransferase [Bryobacteraceae bacterium]|nr:class I SAM-dependent methyltransferase [Bryobacteraceae bacterium]